MEPRRLSRFFLCFPLLILGSWVSTGWIQPAWSEEIYNTPRVSIHYNRPSDLTDMERSLHFSPIENLQQKYFFTQYSPGTDLLPGLTAKVEGLLTKVCMLLNVNPKQKTRLGIFLLADGKQVKQRKLAFVPFGKDDGPYLFGYNKLEGFYDPLTRSIFLSLADLDEGILAHEMAHYVLCVAYSTLPPHEIQENWCRYVEMKVH